MSKAVDLFTAVPKFHNCAQSIAGAFGRDDYIEELKACGGGRSPGGMCGALYAALRFVPEDKQEALKSGFAAVTGSTQCRRHDRAMRVSCVKCVETAERLARELSK